MYNWPNRNLVPANPLNHSISLLYTNLSNRVSVVQRVTFLSRKLVSNQIHRTGLYTENIQIKCTSHFNSSFYISQVKKKAYVIWYVQGNEMWITYKHEMQGTVNQEKWTTYQNPYPSKYSETVYSFGLEGRHFIYLLSCAVSGDACNVFDRVILLIRRKLFGITFSKDRKNSSG